MASSRGQTMMLTSHSCWRRRRQQQKEEGEACAGSSVDSLGSSTVAPRHVPPLYLCVDEGVVRVVCVACQIWASSNMHVCNGCWKLHARRVVASQAKGDRRLFDRRLFGEHTPMGQASPRPGSWFVLKLGERRVLSRAVNAGREEEPVSVSPIIWVAPFYLFLGPSSLISRSGQPHHQCADARVLGSNHLGCSYHPSVPRAA